MESSWPHCTRSSTNLEYRLTGRPPDHEDCQHPGIRTTWPSKGRSPSYPERLVLVVVVVVLVALFLPGRQTDRDGPSNGPPPLHLHSAPVREKGVSSSSSSSSYRSHFLISRRSVFVDERIPLKSNPVARGEKDTISWRMAVSTFPRIAAREEELDRRTHRCRSDLRRDFRISFPDSREFQHLYPVKTGTEEKREEERSVVATRGYAHARIAVLERPKRDATRRTPPPPWRVRAGKRSRHHGRSSGVAALPTVPSRESYSFSVVGHLSLTRSPHTLANDRLSLAIQLLYVRVAC